MWRWYRAARAGGVALLGAAALATAALTLAGQVAWVPPLSPCGETAAPSRAARAPTSVRSGIGLAAWTTFQGSAGHNLVFPGRSGSDPLHVAWRFRAGGGIGTAPAIVAGMAYVAALDHCVYALDARTGKPLWSFRGDNELMSEPLVVSGRVFAGSGDKTVYQVGHKWRRGKGPNTLYALDASSGRLLWRYRTPGENMPTQLYANDTVYAVTGDSTFYAVDASNGVLRWKVAVGSIDSMSSPALWRDIAVFGGAKPYRVFGVDVRTGRVAWSVPMPLAEGGVDDLSAAVADGVAFVQVPEGVYPEATVVEYAIDASTGKILWHRVLGSGTIPTSDKEEAGVATVVDGVVYVGSPALDGLWALDARHGEPIWSQPARLPEGVRASPTVAGGDIFLVGEGKLYVVDQKSGALLRTLAIGTPVPGQMLCAPAAAEVVGSTLYYVGGHGDTLTAVPLKDVMDGTLPASG